MLLNLLFIVLLLGGLALLVPRKWLLPYSLLIIYCALYLLVDHNLSNCAGCGSVGSQLVLGIFYLALFGFVIGVGIRFVLVLRKPNKIPLLIQSNLPSAASWMLIAIGGASLVTFIAVFFANVIFNSGLATHAVVLMVTVAWLYLADFSWNHLSTAERKPVLHPFKVFKYVGAVTCTGWFLWSLSVIPEVIDKAEMAARGQAYCVNTASADGLRPVNSYFELSGFSMQAYRGSVRHATLAMGAVREPVWMYWSYRKQAFLPEFMGGVLSCELQPAYATKLGWFQSGKVHQAESQFWLARGLWRIPREFHGRASDRPPTLHFYAHGNSFEPLAPSIVRHGPRSWEMIKNDVEILLCTPTKLHPWYTDEGDPNFSIEPLGTEHGLEKRRVRSRTGGSTNTHYVGRNTAGKASTWVECHDEMLDCRHAFMRDGVVVRFQHLKSDFEQWNKLQDSVWRRVKSFAIEWPDRPPKSCEAN